MKRMMVGLIILLSLFSGWLWEKHVIGEVCTEMVQSLDEISFASEEGEREKLIKLTEDFAGKWTKKERLLDMLTPHDDTDEINLNLVRLKEYSRKNNFMAVDVIVKEMKKHFEEIEEKLQVNYTNIF